PDGAPDPLDPVESSPEDPANPGDPVPGTVPGDPTEVPVVAPNPSYTLLKGASITTDNGTADVADVDDVITYTFTVANTANVTLSDVVVSDPLPNIGT